MLSSELNYRHASWWKKVCKSKTLICYKHNLKTLLGQEVEARWMFCSRVKKTPHTIICTHTNKPLHRRHKNYTLQWNALQIQHLLIQLSPMALPVSSCTARVPASASQHSAGTKQTSDIFSLISSYKQHSEVANSHPLLMSCQRWKRMCICPKCFVCLFFFKYTD